VVSDAIGQAKAFNFCSSGQSETVHLAASGNSTSVPRAAEGPCVPITQRENRHLKRGFAALPGAAERVPEDSAVNLNSAGNLNS